MSPVLLLSLSVLLAPGARAATGAAAWLEEGLGARWLGMGGAARAAARDVHAGYWNPAALSSAGAFVWEAGSMLAFGSMDRTAASLSAALQTDRAGTFAVTWLRRSIAGLERVDDRGTVTETESSAADAVLVSGGWAPFYELRAGVTAKFMTESVLGSSASGGAVDAGILVQPLLAHEFWIGITVANAAGSYSWGGGDADAPAREVGGGIAWRGLRDRLLAAADIVSREGSSSPALHAGAEFWAVKMAAVRAGWDDGHPTVGASYVWKPYQLDYAFTFDPDSIATRHQLSFLLRF